MTWEQQRCLRTLSRESGCFDQTSLISRAIQIILILNMHFRSRAFIREFPFKFLAAEALRHKQSANTLDDLPRFLFAVRFSGTVIQGPTYKAAREQSNSSLPDPLCDDFLDKCKSCQSGSFFVVEKFLFAKPSARPKQKILEIPFANDWKCLFKSFNTVAAILSFLSQATRSKFLCLY